jgi:hypothetical protein
MWLKVWLSDAFRPLKYGTTSRNDELSFCSHVYYPSTHYSHICCAVLDCLTLHFVHNHCIHIRMICDWRFGCRRHFDHSSMVPLHEMTRYLFAHVSTTLQHITLINVMQYLLVRLFALHTIIISIYEWYVIEGLVATLQHITLINVVQYLLVWLHTLHTIIISIYEWYVIEGLVVGGISTTQVWYHFMKWRGIFLLPCPLLFNTPLSYMLCNTYLFVFALCTQSLYINTNDMWLKVWLKEAFRPLKYGTTSCNDTL